MRIITLLFTSTEHFMGALNDLIKQVHKETTMATATTEIHITLLLQESNESLT